MIKVFERIYVVDDIGRILRTVQREMTGKYWVSPDLLSNPNIESVTRVRRLREMEARLEGV